MKRLTQKKLNNWCQDEVKRDAVRKADKKFRGMIET